MTVHLIFILFFETCGIFYLIKGIIRWHKLDRQSPDYDDERKKARGFVIGGIGLLLIGLIKFYTRIIHNPYPF